jgi:uncharacterized protein
MEVLTLYYSQGEAASRAGFFIYRIFRLTTRKGSRTLVTDLEDLTHNPFHRRFVMKPLNIVAFVLVIVGALNWGLVGTLKFDLVRSLFGDTVLTSIVYTLVGLAGVVLAAQAATLPKRLAHAAG